MMKRGFAVLAALSSVWAVACGGAPTDGASSLIGADGAQTQDVEGNPTLMFVPPGTKVGVEALDAIDSAGTRNPSLFYPKPGQQQDGICWLGLASDSAGNIYPITNAGFARLDRNANVLNGDNDENYFVLEGFSNWGVIDEPVRKVFTASITNIRSAPFQEGGVFSDLIGGLRRQGEGIALGRGRFDGSLFVADAGANRVFRVILQPLDVRSFASGPLFAAPEAVATAPDGTVYVVNVGSVTVPEGRSITKIAPDRTVSVFATANNTTARRMLAVDRQGIVYWSSARGIDRFRPNGTRMAPLPGPRDQAAFENPMGSAFDPQGNLYVVENFGCKKIYKYSL